MMKDDKENSIKGQNMINEGTVLVWFRGLHGGEKKLEGSEGGRLAVIWGENILNRENSKCKGPKAEECLAHWSRLT